MEFNRRSIIHGFALFVLCCASLWRAQAGGPTWAQHFRAPGKTNNVAVAVATDHSGKVFVTGYSYNAVRTADQWTTIAYTSSGAPLWTNIYIGPGATNEQATALAVDNSGNVFVTGYSPATSIAPSYYDIVTIKYSNAGVPLWTNRYNGPADGRDHPNAIAVDDLGDVLIAGYSANLKSYPYDYDYVAIKYASTGDLLWINRHSGSGGGDDVAVALALNNQGDVVVTGSSTGPGSSTDFLTVAYSSGGAPLWTNRHDGAGNDVDTATAIAADATGNVFVTGYSAAMTGFPSDYGYVTLKYSNTGQPLWTNRYDGPNYHDYARAVAVDQQGDVFVAGRSVGNHYDFATIKYSSAGVAQWTNRYDGPGNSDDSPIAIVTDGSGNVIVAGHSFGNASGYDFATLAYSSTGDLLWTDRYSGPANSSEIVEGLVVDDSGNVFVSGYSSSTGGGSTYATVKYSLGSLSLRKVGYQAVISWTNVDFHLQTAPALSGPFTNILGATSPYTNPITGAQQFFRLKAN